MKNQLLHTPEGVRDIYNEECEKKLELQDRLHKALKQHGYHSIQTPTFEFFDIFGKEVGTIPSSELYKFFDREGNTLLIFKILHKLNLVSMHIGKRKRIGVTFLGIKADRNALYCPDIIYGTFLVKIGKGNMSCFFININWCNRCRNFLYHC